MAEPSLTRPLAASAGPRGLVVHDAPGTSATEAPVQVAGLFLLGGAAKRSGAAGADTEPSRAGADYVGEVLRRRGEAGLGDLAGCFAFVARLPDGTVLAGCDPGPAATGLVWALDGAQLLVASTLPALLERMSSRPVLDDGKLIELLALHDDPSTTVYRGVQRLPAGHLLRWRPGSTPTVEPQWVPTMPDVEDLPLDRAAPLVLELLAEIIDDAVGRPGSIAATISGGLDSTAVAALAAEQLERDGRMLQGLTWSPLNDPRRRNRPGWVEDDLPYAQALAEMHPNIELEAIRNDARQLPIERLEERFARLAMPVRNPANQVLVDLTAERAAALGCRALLVGNSGNASLSYDGGVPLLDLLCNGRPITVTRELLALRRREGRTARSLIVGEIARPAVWTARNVLAARPRLALVGAAPYDLARRGINPAGARRLDLQARLPIVLPVRAAGRTGRRIRWSFLWRDQSAALATAPATNGGVWRIDPLGDPRIKVLTASFGPRTWLEDGRRRALARRVVTGRVPDLIRLRAELGEQAADAPAWRHGRWDRYSERLDEVERSSLAADLIDVPLIRRALQRRPEERSQEEHVLMSTIDRTILIGSFVRWHETSATGQPRPIS